MIMSLCLHTAGTPIFYALVFLWLTLLHIGGEGTTV
jgi:hypothetical protein